MRGQDEEDDRSRVAAGKEKSAWARAKKKKLWVQGLMGDDLFWDKTTQHDSTIRALIVIGGKPCPSQTKDEKAFLSYHFR